MRLTRFAALVLVAACSPPAEVPLERDYLYVWTGSADSTRPDFLAVVDITEDSTYGQLVTTVPVSGLMNGPHHTEHEMPADRQLFVNGFRSGKTFIFDLSNPALPVVKAEFDKQDGMEHPHSYLRLPNGNVLATFQMRHTNLGELPGGIAEFDPNGAIIRSASAAARGVNTGVRPYSAAIIPALDRFVVTTTSMDPKLDERPSRSVMIWRLSDLRYLTSVDLPDGPAGGEGLLSAEPRLLDDGRSVLVSTFNCGLYLLTGLETDAPSAKLVASFPRKAGDDCAIPVVAGRYYLVTVSADRAVVSLDISDPAAPREVSRVTLGVGEIPHWLAVSPDRARVVVTGYGAMQGKIAMLRFDSASGQLSVDERFRDPGVGGVPHGVVFSLTSDK